MRSTHHTTVAPLIDFKIKATRTLFVLSYLGQQTYTDTKKTYSLAFYCQPTSVFTINHEKWAFTFEFESVWEALRQTFILHTSFSERIHCSMFVSTQQFPSHILRKFLYVFGFGTHSSVCKLIPIRNLSHGLKSGQYGVQLL